MSPFGGVPYRCGVSERRVNQYCVEGRISGESQFGRSWAIPENAEKPSDLCF
ncbi:DNA-binding protein [Bovifimicola ammoniilytica]|nr:DNA-binding protein [Bovifimicola ammoniilytica]MCU6753740.1 DNA-binding protein [Bovifimicola ammoniilytica]